MATSAVTEGASLERYITEVRSLWSDGKDPELPFKVKGLLEKLLASTSPQEPWIAELIAKGLPVKELYRDEEYGFILKGHVRERSRVGSAHDHGPCWVLYGVYHGFTEITTYARTDDGKLPGHAVLKKLEVHRLTPGGVMPYLPGEIHSTFTAEPSVVLRFLSYDLNQVKRYRYDLQRGTVDLA